MRSVQVPKRNRWTLLLGLLVLLLAAAGAIDIWQRIVEINRRAGVGPEKGQIAPDFSVRTPDGEIVRLSDFHGKFILLNFFATWCGPCIQEAPHLKLAYERKSNNVVFIGVTFQDTSRSVQAFTAKYKVPFLLVLDDSGDVGEAYRVRGFPTTFFIRDDGIVHYVVKGPMTKEFVELILEEMQGQEE